MSEIIDREELLDELDGDTEFLEDSLDIFDSDAPELIEKAREGIKSGDGESVRIAAHTLKSMVGNFCATAAFESAQTLEQLARDENADKLQAAFDALEQSIKALRQELGALLEELS